MLLILLLESFVNVSDSEIRNIKLMKLNASDYGIGSIYKR